MASLTLSYRWLFTLLWKGQQRRHSNIGSLLDGYVNWSLPRFHLLYSLILFRPSLPWSRPGVFARCVMRPLGASIYLLHHRGFIFSKLIKFSHRRGFVDRESYVAQYLAFAVFITGLISTIGSDDLLAAFAAGKSR